MNKEITNEWLSLSDAAALLGVHPSTVRSWADQGDLPVHRTHGGHRRFLRQDVELWLKSQNQEEVVEMGFAIQNALRRTRFEISEGHLANESWYQKLDGETREQYRQSGRSLLSGVISHLTSADGAMDAEARSLGFEYASRGKRCGLTSAEAVNAFIFFRNLLLDSMLGFYENAGVRSPHAWGQMVRRIHAFTDLIMITLIETYESYSRGNSK